MTLNAALGIAQGLLTIYDLDMSDCISYMDISTFYRNGDWRMALNSYWSPMYSWLLALLSLVWPVDPYFKIAIFKAANLLALLAAACCFDLLVQRLVTSKMLSSDLAWPARLFFIAANVFAIGVWRDTPDMLLSAFLYLAVYLALGRSARGAFAAGLALGAAFLTKAAALAVVPGFLLCCIKVPRRAVACITGLLLVAAPFVTCLSLKQKRLVISDAGALNYAWFVSRAATSPHALYKNEAHNFVHPAQVVISEPQVFLYDGVFEAATVPTHYFPPYWFAGHANIFDPVAQAWATGFSLWFYVISFFVYLGIAQLVLVFTGRKVSQSQTVDPPPMILLLPAVFGLVAYAVALNMYTPFTIRYVAPFYALLFIFWSSMVAKKYANPRPAAFVFVIAFALYALFSTRSAAVFARLAHPDLVDHQAVCAKWLQEDQGVPRGAKVATLDIPRSLGWAVIGGIRVVADLPDAAAYNANAACLDPALKRVLGEKGIKGMVAAFLPAGKAPASGGWVKCPNENFYFLKFAPKH
ncbi:MAG: hypothetical protein J0H83_15095 [Candidatus Melainabacteria bacterium]|nr:hypothetical protein [Candidatus Melainabacteria bacterium]